MSPYEAPTVSVLNGYHAALQQPEAGPADPLFLGLDLSTQQLKAIIVSTDGEVVHESAVHFDNDLPKYETQNGAIQGPGKGEVTSPVAMWLDAMELVFERMKIAGVEFNRIRGISGSGQQHGSVYWSGEALSLLSSLNPKETLVSQLSPQAFSLQKAPIWQDSSTTAECRDLEEAMGGAQALADLTGSRAYERFTGPQILKLRHTNPEVYDKTAHISLVSSFMPSLFMGKIAPIEVSDASGMNLTDVLTNQWDDRLLKACGGPELRAKLGPEPAPGGTFLGKVSSWWVEKWGLSPDCAVAPFTGDNPATMVSLSTPGDAIFSLGTSTTFLLSIPPSDTAPKRFTTSHLLSHPTNLDSQIAMLCYKNGALAREHVRDKHGSGDWSTFNECVESTPPGNDGYAGLYFPLYEIIPPNVKGEFFFKDDIPVSDIPKKYHPRAVLESQFLSIKSRMAAILPSNSPRLRRLVLTGGSSVNPTIRQLAADIFGLPAYVPVTKEAAGHGGALLALFAWWKEKNGGKGAFEQMKAALVDGSKLVAEPNMGVSKVYQGLVPSYRSWEEHVVEVCANQN